MDQSTLYTDNGAPCPRCGSTLYRYTVHQEPIDPADRCSIVAAFCISCHVRHIVGRVEFGEVRTVSQFHRQHGPKAIIDARG